MELDVLTEITSVQKCYGACRVTTDCQYYVYRKDNKECKLYLPSNDYFDCDLIRGPATPDYTQVSTSKFKPYQYLNDLIFRLVVEITQCGTVFENFATFTCLINVTIKNPSNCKKNYPLI